MHEDVDPALLEQILRNASTMEIRRRKYNKLRLPPHTEGDAVRSFPHRIVVRKDSMTTNLGPGMARTLVGSVVSQLLDALSFTALAAEGARADSAAQDQDSPP